MVEETTWENIFNLEKLLQMVTRYPQIDPPKLGKSTNKNTPVDFLNNKNLTLGRIAPGAPGVVIGRPLVRAVFGSEVVVVAAAPGCFKQIFRLAILVK